MVIFRFVSELREVQRCQPCPRVIVLRCRREFHRRLQKSFCLCFFSLQPQHCRERVTRRWIVRIGLQNSAQEFLGGSVLTAAAVNLSQIYRDSNAVGPSRECALVKCLLIGPVAAPNKAAHPERDDSKCRGAINRMSPPVRHFDYAADKKKKDADAWKVEPMLGDGRIELHDIRYRNVGGKEPNRPEDSKWTPAAALACAKSEPPQR